MLEWLTTRSLATFHAMLVRPVINLTQRDRIPIILLASVIARLIGRLACVVWSRDHYRDSRRIQRRYVASHRSPTVGRLHGIAVVEACNQVPLPADPCSAERRANSLFEGLV